jgi:hypothetical protein
MVLNAVLFSYAFSAVDRTALQVVHTLPLGVA